MLTLRQLQAFEAVARLSSYSNAAEELGVSQPSVSVQVQRNGERDWHAGL